MTNIKLALAMVLAAASLVLSLTVFVGGVALLAAGLAPVFAISAIALSTAAFVVSWKQRSFPVAGLLAVSGVIYMIPALVFLTNINFAVIEVPGPILGVIFGLAIFGLGVAKGIKTERTVTAAPR